MFKKAWKNRQGMTNLARIMIFAVVVALVGIGAFYYFVNTGNNNSVGNLQETVYLVNEQTGQTYAATVNCNSETGTEDIMGMSDRTTTFTQVDPDTLTVVANSSVGSIYLVGTNYAIYERIEYNATLSNIGNITQAYATFSGHPGENTATSTTPSHNTAILSWLYYDGSSGTTRNVNMSVISSILLARDNSQLNENHGNATIAMCASQDEEFSGYGSVASMTSSSLPGYMVDGSQIDTTITVVGTMSNNASMTVSGSVSTCLTITASSFISSSINLSVTSMSGSI